MAERIPKLAIYVIFKRLNADTFTKSSHRADVDRQNAR